MKNDNFSCDELWSQNYWPKVKSDQNSFRGMRSPPQCLFRILPSYHTFGNNSDCLRKNRYFLEIWPLVTFGDLNIDLTRKLPYKRLRSLLGLFYDVYRLLLSSVVFEFRGGPKRPPSARNQTFQSPPGIGLNRFVYSRYFFHLKASTKSRPDTEKILALGHSL